MAEPAVVTTPQPAEPEQRRGRGRPKGSRGEKRLCLPGGDITVMRIGNDGVLYPVLSENNETQTFMTVEDCHKWIRMHSVEVMNGDQHTKIAIVAFRRILELEPETRSNIRIREKARISKNPETGEQEEEGR